MTAPRLGAHQQRLLKEIQAIDGQLKSGERDFQIIEVAHHPGSVTLKPTESSNSSVIEGFSFDDLSSLRQEGFLSIGENNESFHLTARGRVFGEGSQSLLERLRDATRTEIAVGVVASIVATGLVAVGGWVVSGFPGESVPPIDDTAEARDPDDSGQGTPTGPTAAIDGSPILSVDWAPDGKLLATRDYEQITMWDTGTWKPFKQIDAGGDGPMAWSDDGSHLAATRWDSVDVWETRDYTSFRQFECRLCDVLWSSDGKVLITGPDYDTGQVSVWDIESGERISSFQGRPEILPQNRMALAPDDRHLAISCEPRVMCIWDRIEETTVRTSENIHDRAIEFVGWTPDGTTVISGGGDAKFRFWDPSTGEQAAEDAQDETNASNMQWSHDQTHLVSAGGSRRIRRWSTEQLRVVGDLTPAPQEDNNGDGLASTIDWSPASTTGNYLAAGYSDGSILIWHFNEEPIEYTKVK